MNIKNMRELVAAISDVPPEIEECLNLIVELDRQSCSLKTDIEGEFRDFGGISCPDNKKNYMRYLIKKAKKCSEKKIQLIAQVFAFLDGNVHKLDEKIKDLDGGEDTKEVPKQLRVEFKTSKSLNGEKAITLKHQEGLQERREGLVPGQTKYKDNTKAYVDPKATRQENKYGSNESKENFNRAVAEACNGGKREELRTSGHKEPKRTKKCDDKFKQTAPVAYGRMQDTLCGVEHGQQLLENAARSVEGKGASDAQAKIPKHVRQKKNVTSEKTCNKYVEHVSQEYKAKTKPSGGAQTMKENWFDNNSGSVVSSGKSDVSTKVKPGRSRKGDAQKQSENPKEKSRKKRRRDEEEDGRSPKMLKTSRDRDQVEVVTAPEEPRFCLCRGISYGNMVGCDNATCSIEWFHFGCVGLTSPPTGDWFCPSCR